MNFPYRLRWFYYKDFDRHECLRAATARMRMSGLHSMSVAHNDRMI